MSGAKTVKDVSSHEFVSAYAAYLRSTGKVSGEEPSQTLIGGGRSLPLPARGGYAGCGPACPTVGAAAEHASRR
jgi:hypothetical protein